MWYKCKELSSEGLNTAQISRSTGLNVKTVRKYLGMTQAEFEASGSYRRMYVRLLDPYEEAVTGWLRGCPELSASQVYDRLREHYPGACPGVSVRTVYNFVCQVRSKQGLPKPSPRVRVYSKIEETPNGKYAQADFGEAWMERERGGRVKVYFFVMVLCRSRCKFVFVNMLPFTSALATYVHELAFEYFGGKPEAIIYDQDAVLIRRENLGDYEMAREFGAFVSREGFRPVFCRKGDPESKGKVENVVKYVKGNFLRGRKFVSVEQLNEECKSWLERTGNGLPHGSTGLVPAEELEIEKAHLTQYHGLPFYPASSMRECTVRKDNTIQYRSNLYSVRPGTYHGQGTKVWAEERDGRLDLYDYETGKLVVSHQLAEGSHGYVLDESHRRAPRSYTGPLEHKVLDYCGGSPLLWQWLEAMRRDRARYYKEGLNVLHRGMHNYEPSLFLEAVGTCLDRGVYNARDLLSLCGRLEAARVRAGRVPEVSGTLPAAAGEVPEATDVSQYEGLFA